MTVPPERAVRIECKLGTDARLIAGAAMIAAHVARRAGLSDAAASDLSAAAMEACDALTAPSAEAGEVQGDIQFVAAEFPDRVEVTINLLLTAPDLKHPKPLSQGPVSFAGKLRERLKSAPVDGIEVDAKNGNPQVILVKNCTASKRRFVV